MRSEKLKKWVFDQWRQWRATIFLVVFVILPVKSSLADFNWVPTGSMNPTILEGDLICVNKLAYDLRIPFTLHRLTEWSAPQRGDIVICFAPDDGIRLVKRVVGLPGDEISMVNNQLSINGQSVPQTPTDPGLLKDLNSQMRAFSTVAMEQLGQVTHPVMAIPDRPAMRSFGPVIVPAGRYFVMGDNRDNSKDSRFFGFVPRKAIVGKAVGIVGSLDITDVFQPRFSRFLSPLD
jgi:signal peptidase I